MGILALVGGQYGSEGKGVIANHLAPITDAAIRTGGPNAGHSLVHEGRVWKMRSIPCAWTNPEAELIIGPGAVIDPEVLVHEVNEIEKAGYSIRPRLIVSAGATLVQDADRYLENVDTTGSLVERIGSTGEGVGRARIRKILRDQSLWFGAEILNHDGIEVGTTEYKPRMIDTNAVILEGTQGYGLSLHQGVWPYVTSAQCTAAQLFSDAAVPLRHDSHVMVVFRTFPIRVAGNSGPMLRETSWETITEKVGKPTIEHTTVTKKVRRVGFFDWELFVEACQVNGADSLVLTFADYIDPSIEGVTEWEKLRYSSAVRQMIDTMEDLANAPVSLVGTGGDGWRVVETPAYETLRDRGAGFWKNHDRASAGAAL